MLRGSGAPERQTIVDSLTHWAAVQPDACLFSYLEIDGDERDAYTYEAFEARTRHLAEHIATVAGLRHGDRALLVYPAGLEIIVAFMACVRAGVIPVPVYPPTPMNFEGGLAKIAFVARDCGAAVALTTRGFHRSFAGLLATRGGAPGGSSPALPALEWLPTDDVRGQASGGFRDHLHPTLFLQYTSGSTSDPKGVIVSHENLVHNGRAFINHLPVGVSWLPQYHDMGLIGYYLFPIIAGGKVYGFSPLNFIKRPALWLRTISRVRATITSAPNFGFEYCLREDKLPAEELAGLDLSSLRVMMNAAEPVRPDTYLRFLDRFEPFGLRRDAHVVAYGLAEYTLCVSNSGRQVVTANKQLLQQGTLHLEASQALNNNQVRLMSCGQPLEGVEVRIVDPETREALGEREIGEIWLAGPSRCQGYWNRPALTRELFGATIANEPGATSPYVRTGDLGFRYEGEVIVCGRRKDLIIIRGVNYYPQDIEAIVEAAAPEIRTGGVVAFAVDDEGEALVVVAEIRKRDARPDPAVIAKAIRTHYFVEPHTIVFVPPGSIARTTSGKLARSLTRQRWMAQDLPVIAAHVSAGGGAPGPDVTAPRQRFQYIITLYNLTGEETCTFADIGIDSLTLVRLLDDIKALLDEHGAGAIAHDLDARLLQRLTIAEFFALLDRLESPRAEPMRGLRDVLRRAQADLERDERECMRRDAELTMPPLEAARAPEPVSRVLLTGVTGFFGPFLLDGLLRHTPHVFYTLTRATDPAHGMERIKAALHRSRLLTAELEEALETRVRVVCGNLTRGNLGLSSDAWTTLSETVQAVCHNGALVNYVLNYDALRPANVDGTRELLRFACTGVRKSFHLISSTFIYGWTATPMLFERDDNREMENLDFGYAQSKWVAEQLVLTAGRRGLDVRIYRPSLISAATNGVGSRDDIAVRLLAFMIGHGISVTARNQISFLPADVAAGNIAAIFNLPTVPERTLNVTTDDYYNMSDVTRSIARNYGYEFTEVEIPEFVQALRAWSTPADPVYPLTDFFIRSEDKIAAMQHKRYNNDAFRRARAQSGGQPPPCLDATVAHIVDAMLQQELIPRAVVRRTLNVR